MPFFEEWEQEQQVPKSFWKQAGEQGFLCPWVEEKYGGYAWGIWIYGRI